MSQRDKTQILERATAQLGNLQIQEPDLEAEYGYTSLQYQHIEQVDPFNYNENIINNNVAKSNSSTFSDNQCNYIKPVPSQILTVQDSDNENIHLDLDTGATVSYAKLSTVKKHNFKIKPNSQLSNLADGKTKMHSCGEIDEYFTRNTWKVRFHAIVTTDLHTDFVAGNNFFHENMVTQDITNKSITVLKKYTVPETNKSIILPTSNSNIVLKNNHVNVVLPGQSIQYPVKHHEDQMLAVQSFHQNKKDVWPPPQLCKVSNGFINVINQTNDIISLKKGDDKIQARTLNDTQITEEKCFISNVSLTPNENERFKNVQINSNNIDQNVIDFIQSTNEKYKNVFNEDLQAGYNMNFGNHVCTLNWANDTRPPANKVHNINYDHDTKVLLQQVIDEFTQCGVLGIPQDHNIHIQHVSPAFLVRKQRAKSKPKNELTSKDVRMVVNFGTLNDYLKNFPTPITKPKDIFTYLGRWNYIAVMDLFQGFFQNHMDQQDGQWLGISSPFGGLRFMKRSGQGLIGQSEELDELLSKVLCTEMTLGIVARIADDLYIGGNTPMDTAINYEKVLSKLNSANLKVSADKTKIFLDSVDILGWVWKHGGYLSPSPHRLNSLKNTSPDDISNIKEMRSWIGLYKTLLPASPNLTLLLDPFDKVIAGKQSNEPVQWDESLNISFNRAKEAIDSIQTLYLPSPDDQLLLVVDAAKAKPGLGHILYAVKDMKKLPVSFHSTKLSESHAKWHSCELEALAFATAITAEYHILKESKKPVIISPDSKAVYDAVSLIRKGHHSSNPRIQALITNVNRLPIIVQFASGKGNLNTCGDFQSRHPSPCQTEHCTICNFVKESSESTLNPYAINALKHDDPPPILDNKLAWKKIQDESKSCQQTRYLVTSGKTPSKISGKLNSEIRRLSSIATINNNDMLVVLSKPSPFSTVQKELIVIPSSHLPAVLWQIHNNLHHPTKSQLKSQFDKSFYSVGLHPELEKLYNECYFCATQKKIPSVVPHQTMNDSKVPGTHFHADIIKRSTQCILTIRDNFSSFTVAKVVRSESHKDLKQGIIDLLIPIKLAGQVIVKVDNATGFKPLLDSKDQDLNKLGFLIIPTDVFNINENAVIDKACYELEQELVRLEPDGRQISNTTLQIAVQLLNSKLRRNGKISAFEIYFNRDINSGNNLNLDYNNLKEQQTSTRDQHNLRHNEQIQQQQHSVPQPGDIVTVKTQKHDKHKAKDPFIVTSTNDDKVQVQKLIHTFSDKPTIRSKVYSTDKNRLFIVKKGLTPNVSTQSVKRPTAYQWNPVRQISLDSDDESYSLPSVSLPTVDTTQKSSLSSQVPESPRPQLYQDLDNILQNQRNIAAQQLIQVNSPAATVNTHQSDQLQSPERVQISEQFQTPLSSKVDNTSIDKRAVMKAQARSRITACLKKIPQVDGHFTDSSNTTSAESSQQPSAAPSTATSPTASPSGNAVSNPSAQNYELNYIPPEFRDLLRTTHSSMEWDYREIDDLDDTALDEVFDKPFVDTDFLKRNASADF